MGSVNLANISVTPVISNSVTEWPFEIETSGYTQTITDLPGKGNGQSDMDRRRELTWTLKTREDAPSGYYKLQFTALYYVGTEAESATLTTYVKVVGAPGSGNVETEGSGSSTPRVIVTGFTTDPAEVNAGDTFTLTLHLKIHPRERQYPICWLILTHRRKAVIRKIPMRLFYRLPAPIRLI